LIFGADAAADFAIVAFRACAPALTIECPTKIGLVVFSRAVAALVVIRLRAVVLVLKVFGPAACPSLLVASPIYSREHGRF